MPNAFPQRASLETPNIDVAATDDDVIDVEEADEICEVDEDDELAALETDELELELIELLDDELTALETDELELELLGLLDNEDDNANEDDDKGVAQLETEDVTVSAGAAGMDTVDIIVAVYSVTVEVVTGGGVEISVSTIVVEYSVAVDMVAG